VLAIGAMANQSVDFKSVADSVTGIAGSVFRAARL
jgi:hypothetical protein